MWHLIPKLPVALLLCVIGLWLVAEAHGHAWSPVVRVAMTSRAFPLQAGTRGTWDLDWSEWSEEFAPTLSVLGLPDVVVEQHAPVELLLRVEPRSAVTLATSIRVDEDGWFDVASLGHGSTVAAIDRIHSRRIEYRVPRAVVADGRVAQLHIEGEVDPYTVKAILLGAPFRHVLASAVGAPLLLWMVGGFVRRWIDRRRAAAANSVAIEA